VCVLASSTLISSSLFSCVLVEDVLILICLIEPENESQKIATWLSPLNFWATQGDTLERRQPGTGEWIFKEPAFKAWLDGSERVLWCPGLRRFSRSVYLILEDAYHVHAAGAGKTVLASVVIDYLDRTFKEDTGTQLAFMYCNYKEKRIQTATNLIASLSKQFVQTQVKDVIPEVLELYKRHSKRDTRPSLLEYCRVLRLQLETCPRSFIVLDALDECDEISGTRSTLIKELLRMPKTVSLMVTSRHVPSIESQLDGSQKLEICATDADIRVFLGERILSSPRLRGHIRTAPELKDMILDTIILKAKGMYVIRSSFLDTNNRLS
jgi:hypothetical protein